MANIVEITQNSAALPIAPQVAGYLSRKSAGNIVQTADGRLHLLYHDTGRRLVHAQSLDLGVTWTASEYVEASGTGTEGHAIFVGPTGDLHCAFFAENLSLIHQRATASPWTLSGTDTVVHAATHANSNKLVCPAWDGTRLVLAFSTSTDGSIAGEGIDIVHSSSPFSSWTDDGTAVSGDKRGPIALIDRAAGGLILVDTVFVGTTYFRSQTGTWNGSGYSWGATSTDPLAAAVDAASVPQAADGFRNDQGLFVTAPSALNGGDHYLWRSLDDGATWDKEVIVSGTELSGGSAYLHAIGVGAPDDSMVWVLNTGHNGVVGSGYDVSRFECVGEFGSHVATEYVDEDGNVIYLSPTVKRNELYNGDQSALIAGYLDNGTPEWRTLLGTLPAPASAPPAGRGRWSHAVARISAMS